MTFDTLYQPLIENTFIHVMWLTLALLIISSLKLLIIPKLRGFEGEFLVKRKLHQLNLEALHDVILPDGQGGLTQIDHIVLMPDYFLVIETKNYKGVLLGSEKDRTWTHKIGKQTHYPQNPLRQNYLHIKAVETIELNVPVHGLVVFTNDSKFPKGLPNGVSQIKTLKRDLEHQVAFSSPTQQLLQAWERLKQEVRTDKTSKKQHMDAIINKHGADKRKKAGYTILIISLFLSVILSVYSVPKNDHLNVNSVKSNKDSTISNKNKISFYNTKSQTTSMKIIGYKEIWVPGKAIEQCVGIDRELNEHVLRCRNGYKKKVPIYHN